MFEKNRIAVAYRIVVIAALMTACGCRATTEFKDLNNFEIHDAGALLNEVNDLPVGDHCPAWANEPPRIDIFDASCQGDNAGASTIGPSQGVPAFSIDDLGVSESCLPENSGPSEFTVSGNAVTYPGEGERNAVYPRDEYLHDGGDRRLPVKVRSNWRIDGLDQEDTIAHFDTLSGETAVVHSNRTRIYAPRFAATRHVTLLKQNRTETEALGSTIIDSVAQHNVQTKFGAVKQPMATVRAVGASIGTIVEEHQQGLLVDDIDLLHDYSGLIAPYSHLEIMTRGVFEVDQQESVLHFANAAKAWSAVEFAQATVLGMLPTEQKNVRQTQAAVVYEVPDGQARLRLVKLASASDAFAGDVVTFSIRFDNTGDQPIGNVTIIDNLTTRLEYVEDSEECTVEADFSEDKAISDSLALRWEVKEPLEPGQGGVITFKCRVR